MSLEEFNQYAQTRTVTGSQGIGTLEELRGLIEQHAAWGWTLAEFQERAGVRIEGDTAYVTQFYWSDDKATLNAVWELVQYIHRYYSPR
ncbi:hypothetical protein [Deinococcus ruber]|uniref:Uncharacterized protein n=1 Tax=Deinococcus ruber TaxID=1848197 RepID=A0A918F4I9_9DEIO|nr:hypothetical protein [Deinococcus ruber]GGR00651.1 hypothetical protein GCM10008957_11850 [Deinococcus ruber]